MRERAVRFGKLASVSFHAEGLHDDRTWVLAERFAIKAAQARIRLTFFVHPFWAVKEGRSQVTARRVRRLHEFGHEIGQHTHYYDRESAVVAGRKVTDLDPANVIRRLDEDYAWLLEAGIEPKGYVSGGWAIPPVLAGWLAERAFAYDCSYRRFALSYVSEPASPGEGAPGPFDLGGGVLEVPTTAPLRAALSGFSSGTRRGHGGYQLIYLHDDDQLVWRKRWGLRTVVRYWRHAGFDVLSAGELAHALRFAKTP